MQIATYSLLLEYKGSDAELKPFALLSHYDVVPANASVWSVPPFGGVIKDGCALLLWQDLAQYRSDHLFCHSVSRAEVCSSVSVLIILCLARLVAA